MKDDTLKSLRKIKLKKDADGRYTPSDLADMIARGTVVLYQSANLGVANGWAGVVEETGDLANIQSDTYVDPETVMAENTDVIMKEIKDIVRAEKYAYAKNAKNEAGTGAKLATEEWSVEQVGADATRTVRIGADGTTPRHFNDWTLYELFKSALDGATSKTFDNVVNKKVDMLQTEFDWRNPFSANLKLFVIIQTALEAYGQPANYPDRLLVSSVTSKLRHSSHGGTNLKKCS